MMFKFLQKLRYWLIPEGTRRERAYHALFAIYYLMRTYGARVALDQTRAQQAGLNGGISLLFSRAGLRHLVETLQSFWVRGLSSIMLVQTAYAYQDWMARVEPDEAELAAQRRQQADFGYRPLISIVTPVYNPGVGVLRDTLEAVLAQTYPNWEFCLANASSEGNTAVGQLLDEYARKDERIRVLHLEENLGISGNSNRALEAARGEYIALLDHDDLLSPDMMYCVVEALNENPALDVVYFDEDKISEDGQTRHSPWFKPSQWSPDLMLSTNVWMHSVLRRELVVDAGGFDTDKDGAQDWDLSLRLMADEPVTHHIPRVFYHWRQVEGSAARDANAKPWAYAAQERCIGAHLARLGVQGAHVSFPRLGTVRIIWPPQQAKASIIIPTKNNLGLLRPCISSILEKTTYPDYEILLVDNGSDDPAVAAYYEELTDHERVRILSYPHPFNYHTINNWAARQSTGEVLVFLNNDTEVIEPTWLDELVGWAMRDDLGVVGAKLKRPNGKIQHAGMIMGLIGHASHIFEDCDDHAYTPFGSVDWYRNYHAVTGACMAVRRAVFDEVGGMDETYIVGYGDIDFCLRVRERGYRNVYTPFAELLHHEGGSRGLSLPAGDVLRASVKMFDVVRAGDGYFNPNLSYSSRVPLVAPPQEEERGARLTRIMRAYGLIGLGMSQKDWEVVHDGLTDDLLVGQGGERSNQNSEKPLRVLVVSHELTRSGAPILLFRLAKHMQKRGVAVQAVCSVDGDLRRDYEAHDIPVTILPHLLEDARAVLSLLGEVDVVLCNTILTWRVIYGARAFGRTAVWMLHETQWGSRLAKQNLKLGEALQTADRVVFPSETTAVLYRDFFAKPEEMFSLHAGLDVDTELRPTERVIDKKEDELHVLCLATVETRKGQDILLDAVARLPRKVARKVHVHLIGRTHIDKWFARKIMWRAWWRRNVHMRNEIPSALASQYLLQCDVFALTSRDEALPLSLIEAMALGRAIVCTKAGGVAEVIRSGENGFVAELGDAQAIAEYLTRLYRDPELRERLGAAAREDYKRLHTMTHFGDGILAVIEQEYGMSSPQVEAKQR